MVRAKFICQRIEETKYAGSKSTNIILTAVTAYNEQGQEDKSFWQYTPSGEIKLTTVNEAAVAQFTPGKKYYVDFSETN